MSSNIVDVPSSGEATDNDDILVDDTEGGVLLLSSNLNRKSALILNVGDEDMRVTTDGSTPSPTHGKLIPSGSSLALLSPFCSIGEVRAIRQGLVNTIANASEVT